MTTYAGRPVFPAFFVDSFGTPQASVLVTVYNRGTVVKPTLYTDRTKATTLANPFYTDVLGNVFPFVDPGDYDALVNGATIPFTVVADPAELADAIAALSGTYVPVPTIASVKLGRNAGAVSDPTVAITALGDQALAAHTTGLYNSAFGFEALKSLTTGYYNTAVGYNSLRATTTGVANTCVGLHTGRNLTTGNDNTALGAGAFDACTTGYYNTALGSDAYQFGNGNANVAVGVETLSNELATPGNGTGNTAVGTQAMRNSLNAAYDVAVGYQALRVCTGSNNTAIGNLSGYLPPNGGTANATTTGEYNCFVGSETGQFSATQRSGAVAIGYQAQIDGNGAIAIGRGVQANAAGAVAIGRDSAGVAAYTATVDEIKLGTTTHKVHVTGQLQIGAAVRLYYNTVNMSVRTFNDGSYMGIDCGNIGNHGDFTQDTGKALIFHGYVAGKSTGATRIAAIANADGTLADITTKFNLMLAYWRLRGDIAS